MEAPGLLEVGDQERAGGRAERTGQHRRQHAHDRLVGGVAEQHQQGGDHERASCHGLGDEVGGHPAGPRHGMSSRIDGARRRLVAVARRRSRVVGRGVGPHQAVVGDPRAGGYERRLVGSLVEQLRPGALLGGAHVDVVAGDHLGDPRLWIIEVTGHDRLGRADHHARRLQAELHSVRAEVALLGGVLLGVDVDGVIRAGVHARLAADAARRVEVDDAVGPPEQRSGRADRDARRGVAVVAPQDREQPAAVGVLTLLDVLQPGAVDAEGHLVLGLAGNGARMAADAAVLVDEEAEAGH